MGGWLTAPSYIWDIAMEEIRAAFDATLLDLPAFQLDPLSKRDTEVLIRQEYTRWRGQAEVCSIINQYQMNDYNSR